MQLIRRWHWWSEFHWELIGEWKVHAGEYHSDTLTEDHTALKRISNCLSSNDPSIELEESQSFCPLVDCPQSTLVSGSFSMATRSSMVGSSDFWNITETLQRMVCLKPKNDRDSLLESMLFSQNKPSSSSIKVSHRPPNRSLSDGKFLMVSNQRLLWSAVSCLCGDCFALRPRTWKLSFDFEIFFRERENS